MFFYLRSHIRCRSMDCLFREKTHTQKKLRLFFGRHLHTSTYGATCRGLSISPITRLTRAKKMYPLQGLRSESKCVMADSLWICVDYLYLVHNGVIVDPLIEPAAFRLSRTRPSPLAIAWWRKGRHRNLLHATHPSYLRFAAISRVISCSSSFPSRPCLDANTDGPNRYCATVFLSAFCFLVQKIVQKLIN
jgi:hypothetical protein